MRLLLVALGSRGDVVPALGLVGPLVAAGHEVSIAANPEFDGLVRESGAAFVALPGDARTISSFPRGWRTSPRFLADQAAALTTYLTGAADALMAAAPGHDVLMPNVTARFADDVAEGMGIPSVGLYTQPVEPTSAFPPILFHTARDLGRVGNRLAGRAALASATPFHAASRRVRAALGLPARRRRRPGPVVHGWSPHVLPRPADWRRGLTVAGYWRPPVPAGWEPDPELVDFLDAGDPPVLIGFGSMAAGQDGWLSEVVAHAVRGRRAIVQRGWAGLEAAAGADVLVVGDVPHDWLLPRVAAVVHHGGAGTAGAVFAAGVPGVAVPVYADQPLWAAQAVRLGTGPDPLPFTRLTGPALAARIDAVTRSPRAQGYRAAAAALAARIATDAPSGPVLDAVARLGERD